APSGPRFPAATALPAASPLAVAGYSTHRFPVLLTGQICVTSGKALDCEICEERRRYLGIPAETAWRCGTRLRTRKRRPVPGGPALRFPLRSSACCLVRFSA